MGKFYFIYSILLVGITIFYVLHNELHTRGYTQPQQPNKLLNPSLNKYTKDMFYYFFFKYYLILFNFTNSHNKI